MTETVEPARTGPPRSTQARWTEALWVVSYEVTFRSRRSTVTFWNSFVITNARGAATRAAAWAEGWPSVNRSCTRISRPPERATRPSRRMVEVPKARSLPWSTERSET